MKFVAFERTQQGTGASRRLRKSGKVPGIVFGAGDPAMIELDHNALYFALKKEAFHSTVLEMELTGAVQKVLLRDVQMHPYRAQVLHVDFQRVDDTTRLHKKVPLHFKGEELSSAVKTDHCLVSHVNNEVEVECLATLLPEFIEVDLSGLTKGQSLKASELKVPEGIKVVRHGRLDPVIVAATPPKAEVEAAPTDDAAAAAAAAAPAAAPTPAPAKGAAKPAAKTGAAAKKK